MDWSPWHKGRRQCSLPRLEREASLDWEFVRAPWKWWCVWLISGGPLRRSGLSRSPTAFQKYFVRGVIRCVVAATAPNYFALQSGTNLRQREQPCLNRVRVCNHACGSASSRVPALPNAQTALLICPTAWCALQVVRRAFSSLMWFCHTQQDRYPLELPREIRGASSMARFAWTIKRSKA